MFLGCPRAMNREPRNREDRIRVRRAACARRRAVARGPRAVRQRGAGRAPPGTARRAPRLSGPAYDSCVCAISGFAAPSGGLTPSPPRRLVVGSVLSLPARPLGPGVCRSSERGASRVGRCLRPPASTPRNWRPRMVHHAPRPQSLLELDISKAATGVEEVELIAGWRWHD